MPNALQRITQDLRRGLRRMGAGASTRTRTARTRTARIRYRRPATGGMRGMRQSPAMRRITAYRTRPGHARGARSGGFGALISRVTRTLPRTRTGTQHRGTRMHLTTRRH